MKSIAIVGTQALLAASVVAMGIVLLAGPDFHAQHLLVGQIGDIGRVVVGVVQIVAGICLMLPRGHVIATLLLALLTVGIMGVMIGRAAEGDAARVAPKQAMAIQSAVGHVCERSPGMLLRLTVPRERAI